MKAVQKNRQNPFQSVVSSVFAIFLSSTFFFRCQGPSEASDPAIYGGIPVPASVFPEVVGLLKNGNLFCSGVVVTKDAVITAAHCLTDDMIVNPSIISIYSGDGADQKLESDTKAKSVTIHTKYTKDQLGLHDIAMIQFSNVEPLKSIPILSSPIDIFELFHAQEKITLVGFGKRENGRFGTKYMAETTISGWGAQELRLGGNGRDACLGDSGGPALAQMNGRWVIVGIASRGEACGKGGLWSRVDQLPCSLLKDLANDRARCDDEDPIDAAINDDSSTIDFQEWCERSAFNLLSQEESYTLKALQKALHGTSCETMLDRRPSHLDLQGLHIRNLKPISAWYLELAARGLPVPLSIDLRGNDLRSLRDLGPIKSVVKLSFIDIAGNNLTSTEPFSPDETLGEEAQNGIEPASAFLKICREQNYSPTIAAIFNEFKTTSCAVAAAKLNLATTLDLHGKNISSIAALAGLSQLQFLNLSDNHIQDLSPLRTMEKLREVDVSWNDHTSLELAGVTVYGGELQNTKHVSTLFYTMCRAEPQALVMAKIAQQTNARSCKTMNYRLSQLTSLDLSASDLDDISFLRSFTQITDLSLAHNRLSDISPLLSLSLLRRLDLSDNVIANFEILNEWEQHGLVVVGKTQQRLDR